MELCYKAVKGTANTAALTLALADLERNIDQPPDQFLGLNRLLLGTHRQANIKELRYAFLDRQTLRQKLILSQRRLDLEDAACLNEIRK